MTLAELIARLSREPVTSRVPLGFARPHSYRGDYACLAFEPQPDTTVGEMLHEARSASGETYQGWKGGNYRMGPSTIVVIAAMGETNTEQWEAGGLSEMELWNMLHPDPKRARSLAHKFAARVYQEQRLFNDDMSDGSKVEAIAEALRQYAGDRLAELARHRWEAEALPPTTACPSYDGLQCTCSQAERAAGLRARADREVE